MAPADKLIQHISKLLTPKHHPPVKGSRMREVTELLDAFVAIRNGEVIRVGTGDPESWIGPDTEVIDATGMTLIPGLIDSHTHLVHFGSREDEAKKIAEGVPYMDILKAGGGILSTVRSTRNATEEQLIEKAGDTLKRMLSFGVTTIEAKSGYGLDHETEMKQLRVAKALKRIQPVRIVSTYLGAHAIPTEFKENRKAYLDLVLRDIRSISESDLADAVDVFMEEGVFNREETELILEEATRSGLDIHLHADEIVSLGGAGLGIKYHARSVDHLMAISDSDISLLAESNTIGNVLPTTSFFLKKGYAPARKMIDAGVALAISSDYNPGSAPSENYMFSLQLAFNKLQMLPEEILTAATINPAFSLGLDEQIGTISEGKSADLVLLDVPNFEQALLDFGVNHVAKVFISGKLVYSRKEG